MDLHVLSLVAAFVDGRTRKMSNYDWVFWLNVTNIALGVVVILAVMVVAYGVAWELVIRHKKRRGLRDMDGEMQATLRDEFAHTMHVPELGLTMADGGERVKPSPKKPVEEKKSK
jgi:hypothetical protein